jgi:hypothetical protein
MRYSHFCDADLRQTLRQWRASAAFVFDCAKNNMSSGANAYIAFVSPLMKRPTPSHNERNHAAI